MGEERVLPAGVVPAHSSLGVGQKLGSAEMLPSPALPRAEVRGPKEML